jgi:hypothetical protein
LWKASRQKIILPACSKNRLEKHLYVQLKLKQQLQMSRASSVGKMMTSAQRGQQRQGGKMAK